MRGRVSVGSVLVATAALAVGASAMPAAPAAAQGGMRALARTPSAPTWTMPPSPAPEPSSRSHPASESSFVTQRPVAGGQVTADLGVVPTTHAGPGGQGLPDDGLATVTGVAGYPLEAPGALRPVRFGDSADRLVQLGLAQGPVTLSSKDLRVRAPRQAGQQVSHAGAATDTDLAYRVEPTGVKEALVLRSAKSPTSYRFHLADPSGQLGSARALPGGGVTFTGRQGDLALSMPPAVAYEQAGADAFVAPVPSQPAEPAAVTAPSPITSAPTAGGAAPAVPLLPGSDSATLHVVAAGDGFDVTVAVGPDWLRGKRFPVVLDPSLVFGNADGTVFDATTVVNGNYALVAHTDDRVGPQVEYNYMWRSYLRFNTSAIPAGATVTSARFHWVRQWGGSYSPRPLELHAINGDWNMNSSSYTMNSLTDATAAATGTPDTQDFDVTALARDWVSGTRGNYGISAQLNPEVMNDAYAYGFYGYYASRSTSAPSPDVTPHLFVTYNQTTPLPVDVTSLTPHNAAMTATWSTSKDNGPNGPDGYYVDVFDSGGNYVGYANGQPATGNSVTFGSAYNPYSNSWTNFPDGYALSVRVNPHNGAGFGGYGAARSATVQGAPSAVYGPDGNPTTPPSVAVGDGTVSATWTTGNLHGGTLQGYVAFLYPVGQHWPQAATATCYPVLSGTVTFGPAPSGDCSGTAPVNGTAYTVEVFEQNYSGDNYSGPLTDNTGTGPGYGPPATSGTPPAASSLTPGGPSASNAAVVTAETPTLSAYVSSGQGDTLTTSFAVTNAAVGGTAASGQGTSVAGSGVTSWTVPLGKLSNGVTYSWAAIVCNSAGYCAPARAAVYFTVQGTNTLPTLPGTTAYDGNGCGPALLDDTASGGPTPTSDCASLTDPSLMIDASDPANTASSAIPASSAYYGYVGPWYTPTPDNTLHVIPATVSTATGAAPWSATGLVLNGLLQQDAPAVTVSATLLNVSGQTLGTATGAVAFTLRAGEPGPFQLTSNISAAIVASVTYSVTTSGVRATTPRPLRIDNNWELSAGSRPPLKSSVYTDPDPSGTTEPDVSGGMVANAGTSALSNPSLVSAWYDATGRVVFVSSAPLVDSAGNRVTSLAAGASSQFLLSAGLSAPSLKDLLKMTWAYGS